MGARGWEKFIERRNMEKEQKRKLKEIIDKCKQDDSILLITNDNVVIIGTIKKIVSNIMFAKLLDEDLSNIIEILKKL